MIKHKDNVAVMCFSMASGDGIKIHLVEPENINALKNTLSEVAVYIKNEKKLVLSNSRLDSEIFSQELELSRWKEVLV